MGIIIRQTIKGSIYSYLGALLGFVNVALLMPAIFTTEQIGLTSLLISVSIILGQLGSMGFINITTRLFPYFRNKENSHNGFLGLAILTSLAGFVLCLVIYYVSKSYLISENIEKSPLFANYIYLLVPLIFFTIYYLLLDAYNRMLYNASFGTFLKDFLLRILNLIGIALFWMGWLDFRGFIYYYTLAYGLPTIGLGVYLLWKKEFSLKLQLNYITPKLKREMMSVGLFGLISGFSGIVVINIDRYMVNHYLDLSATGIYATAFYFGTLIMLPGRSLRRIGSSVITQALKDNDLETVKQVYYKSTLNMLIAAIGLFLLIWANEHNIFKMLPAAFYEGRMVIFFIGIAHILNMIAGASGEIIQFSKHYRMHAIIMGIFIALIIFSNMILIPVMGIVGAAVASAASYLLYDLMRFWFLLRNYGFQPYNYRHIIVIAAGVITYALSLLVPEISNWIVDGIIRSCIVSVIFGCSLYFLKVSTDMNHSILMVLNRITCLFKKQD
jgi:O-antigen/teichoic acid export membrane protein